MSASNIVGDPVTDDGYSFTSNDAVPDLISGAREKALVIRRRRLEGLQIS
ncbi:MAG: hypothetical protein ABSD13_15620 [Candidatus Korobacteraceae bacterium]|jgi:hypothetical protein